MTGYELGNNLKVEAATTGFGVITFSGDTNDVGLTQDPLTVASRDTTLPDGPGVFGDFLTTTGGATETLSWATPTALALPTFSAYIIRWRSTAANSGDFFTGAWRTRPLNNRQRYPTTGTDVQLAVAPAGANQMRIVDGVYYVEAFASAFRVGAHQARLQNITDGVTEILGSTEYEDITQLYSKVVGVLSVTGGPKVYELQHNCSVSFAADGFGVKAAVLGGVDVGNSTSVYVSFIKLV